MHSCWETARVLDLLKEISFYLCPLRTLKEFTDLMLSKKKRVVTDTTYSGYYYRAKKIKAYLHDSKKERDNQQKEHQGKHHQKRCRIPDRKQHLLSPCRSAMVPFDADHTRVTTDSESVPMEYLYACDTTMAANPCIASGISLSKNLIRSTWDRPNIGSS